MNKLVILSMLLVCIVDAMQWRNWEAGLKEAQKSGKMVMIDAVRDGCHYCEDMERTVFADSNMSAYIEAHFVPVKINLSHEKMPMGHRVPMTPSFYFFTPQGVFVKMVPGSWNKVDFRDFLEKVQHAYAPEPVAKSEVLPPETALAGQAVYYKKCASCHMDYLPMDELLHNYTKTDNALGLKGPTINQLSFQLKRQIGDPHGDEEFHRLEVTEFIRDYIKDPSFEKSVCIAEMRRYFKLMPSMAGAISDEEIDAVSEWIYNFDLKERK